MIFISFGSNGYEKPQARWNNTIRQQGFDTICYGQQDVTELQPYIYGPRGYGYWVWKPYVILQALKTHPRVFYTDLDFDVINAALLISFLGNRESLLFHYRDSKHGLIGRWTKRDCFCFMGMDSERYYNAHHIEAGVQYWTNTPNNINILTQWLGFAVNRAIISDDPNICGLPNLPGFVTHRHDQSILAILSVHYGVQSLELRHLAGMLNENVK